MHTIVIPTLNEKENLKELLPGLFSPDCEIIVCDNGSTDGTVRLVEDARYSFNIRLSKGTGTVADAILRGIKDARYDKIIIMDGDGSHSFQTVPKLVRALDECDMVIASRYIQGGGSKDFLKNRLISRIGCLVAKFLRFNIKDNMSGFFGIRRSLVTGVEIRNNAKPMLEFLVRAKPLSVIEVPYIHKPRLVGESKIGRRFSILGSLIGVVLLYLYKFKKPLKFLTVGGTGLLLNLSILWLLTDIGGVWYMFSAVVAIGMATTWNYLLNNYWTFEQKGLL